MAVRKLSVVLDLDTSRWNGKLSGAKGDVLNFGGAVRSTGIEANRFSAQMGNVGRSMATPTARLRDLMVILGQARSAFLTLKDVSVGWLGAIFKQAGEIERLTVLMKGLSTATTDIGKNQDAQKSLSALYGIARTSGFAVQELAQSFVKIKSGGIDPMNGSLRGLVDATAAFGGNSDTLNRAAIAIQQMAGKGVISMEELRQQLGEAVPSAMNLMARAMGKTMPELAKEIQKGTVQAKPALAKMFAEMERVYAGSGEKLANTLFGQMAQVKSNWAQLTTDFTGMGQSNSFFSNVVGHMKELNTLMRSTEARSFLSSLGQGIGNVAGVLVSVVKLVVEYKEVVSAVVKGLVTVFAMRAAIAGINAIGGGVMKLTQLLNGLKGSFMGMDAGTAAQTRYNIAVALGRTTVLGSAQAEAQRARAVRDAAVQAQIARTNELAGLKAQETQLRANQRAQNDAQRAAQLAASQNVVMARAAAAAAAVELERAQQTAIAKASKNIGADPAIQAARAASIAAIGEEQAAIARLDATRAQSEAIASNSALTKNQRAQQMRTALRQQQIAEAELATAQRNRTLATTNQSNVEQSVLARRLAGRTLTAQEISAQNRLTQANAAVTASLRAEANAMAANTTVANAKARSGFALLANAEKQIVANAAVTAAINTTTAAITRETIANAANTAAKRVYTVATNGAAAAARIFGAAVNLALGPLGIIAMLAYQAAQAFGVFETAADRATAAAERMRQGFAAAGDAAMVAAQKASLSSEIQKLEADKQRGGGVTIDHSKQFWQDGYFAVTAGNVLTQDKLIAQKKAEMMKLDGARTEGLNHAYRQRQQYHYDSVIGAHEKFKSKLSETYANTTAAIEKNSRLSDDQRKAAYARVGAQYDREIAQDLARNKKRLQAQIDSRKARGLNYGPLRDAMNQLNEQSRGMDATLGTTAKTLGGGKGFNDAVARGAGQIAQMGAKAEGSAGNLAKLNAEIAAGASKYKDYTKAQLDVLRGQAATKDALSAASAGQKKAANAADDLDGRLQKAAGTIAQLTEELKEGDGTLASFNAQLEAGAFKGVPADKIEQMREYLKIIMELNRQKDVKASTARIDTELVKSKTEADALWKSFTNNTMEADKRLQQITTRFAGITDGLKGADLDAANLKIAEIVQNLKNADAADIAQGWRDSTIEIRNGLLSEEEQRQKNYEREVARQRSLIELTAAGTAERRQMEAAFTAWEKAQKDQQARQNEGAVGRMARDWAKMGQGIQETMAQAVSSYVNGIGEAEFNTGEFVVGIVKSLLKVITTALIAYAILSAMGMANNSAGEHVSLGSFMKGQIGGSFGQTNTATNIGNSKAALPAVTPSTFDIAHTGGVIGGALKSISGVNPAVFANAQKYHTGGFIGERPLAPGEHPIIAKEKELMLTEDQQNLLGRRLAGGGGVAPSVKIDFINNSGTEMDAEVGEPSFNGKEWVIGIVTEATHKQGPLRTALEQIGAGK